MTIYLFSALYLFYSRIIFKKLDDSARILFRKVEKTFKNAAKLRADINFLKCHHYNDAQLLLRSLQTLNPEHETRWMVD